MHLNPITRKSAVAALLLLVVIFVATNIRRAVAPFGVEIADYGMLSSAWGIVAAVALFIAGGFVVGKIQPRSGLMSGYTTLSIPLYALLSCGIFVASNVLSAAAVSLCFAIAIFLLLRSLHAAEEKDSVFFAAALLSVMALIYPPSIVLFGLIPIALFALALSMRQLILMLVGYLFPILTASYVSWYAGNEFWSIVKDLTTNLVSPHMMQVSHFPYVAVAMLVAVVVILIFGAFYGVSHRDRMSRLARTRRALHLFILITLLALTMFLFPSCDITLLAIVAVPLAVLLSYVFDLLPNNYSTIAYWVLLALFVLHLFVE